MTKLLISSLVTIIIPTYTYHYGLLNFLWFSDIALFMILLALWLNSSLLMGMSLVLTFFMEACWSIDFFYQFITGNTLLDIASYMFDPSLAIYLRVLSLFHLLLPVIPIIYLRNWGYHSKTLPYTIALFWFTILVSYLLTPIHLNINWVHYPSIYNWQEISQATWLCMLLVLYPLLIMLPKDYIFRKIFKPHNEL
jgi:hypothetical protein